MNAHAPSVPPVSATLHDSHRASHAVSQQTPSTQKPLVHSIAAVQGAPLAAPAMVVVVVVVVVDVVVVLGPAHVPKPGRDPFGAAFTH